MTFTPRRFGLLQAALRDMYELVAVLPGNEAMRDLIEDRVGRLNKLVLNGWDDRDEDGLVEWPSECAHLGTGPDGQPLGLGGLQMAERTLSGETGSRVRRVRRGDARHRDRSRARLRARDLRRRVCPSALANSITFTLAPWSPARASQAQDAGGGRGR